VQGERDILQPRVEFAGPVLEFDFPGVRVGVAEYEEGPTGCTVVVFDAPRRTAIDVQGGWPGTIGEHEQNSAIVLAGGSIYGLEAAAGAGAELLSTAERRVPDDPLSRWQPVSGAIIYDFGPTRLDHDVYPDYALGRAAVRAARPGVFPLGARGAGRCARVGSYLFGKGEDGGQGAAFRRLGEVRLFVCTVVNALGAVVGRDGQVVRGHRAPSGERVRALAEIERRLAAGEAAPAASAGNTTLTVVVTNARMDRRQLTQLGRQVHSSMTRAIEPFHTILDGDVLYAVTTDEVDSPLPSESLGMLASELAWDAVLAAVR
jgi:6-aminohexanoate-oligomer endohydrolase